MKQGGVNKTFQGMPTMSHILRATICEWVVIVGTVKRQGLRKPSCPADKSDFSVSGHLNVRSENHFVIHENEIRHLGGGGFGGNDMTDPPR